MSRRDREALPAPAAERAQASADARTDADGPPVAADAREPSAAQARAAAWSLAWISLAVLFGCTVWFSATAAAGPIAREWGLDPAQRAWLTSATQLGFIAGTGLLAVSNVADVLRPRVVFAASAVLAAAANAAFALLARDLATAIALRVIVGICLAGIYPVAMKLVATWFDRGLGWRLGVMVGALTLGTASPYGVVALAGPDAFARPDSWRAPVLASSGLALLAAAIAAVLLRDGPYLQRRSQFDPRRVLTVWRERAFTLTALGYFGHMWELYALWAALEPWLGASFAAAHAAGTAATVPGPATLRTVVFVAIAAGALGCVVAGAMSRRLGERRVARLALLGSGACGLASPWVFGAAPWLVVGFALVWGVLVIADSPQFSAMAARYAPRDAVGTALALQNGLGFAVTIGSLQLIPRVADHLGWGPALVPLALGPALGLLALAEHGRAQG